MRPLLLREFMMRDLHLLAVETCVPAVVCHELSILFILDDSPVAYGD
jgi:hypothetical protein